MKIIRISLEEFNLYFDQFDQLGSFRTQVKFDDLELTNKFLNEFKIFVKSTPISNGLTHLDLDGDYVDFSHLVMDLQSKSYDIINQNDLAIELKIPKDKLIEFSNKFAKFINSNELIIINED